MSQPVVHLADNCNASKEKYCYTPTSHRTFREAWLASHELFIDEKGRVYTDVLLNGEPAIMDAMTGSLYRDGKCLSSSRLQLGNLTENREEAEKVLREMRNVK
jgi:hypothetical protein